jgi:hypothetical protein
MGRSPPTNGADSNMDELKRDPTQSDRSIAEKAKTDHKTVAAARAAAESGGEIPHHDLRVGADGVMQPATKRPHGVRNNCMTKEERGAPIRELAAFLAVAGFRR